MSCNTPTSIARSLSASPPLSPSDESRFVPHSSVVDASSLVEQHFAASTQEGQVSAEQVHVEKEEGAIIIDAVATGTGDTTTQDSGKEPSLFMNSEKSGDVGATGTIERAAFAPPPSSGMVALQIASHIDSQASPSFTSDESSKRSSQKSTKEPPESGIVGTTICCTPEASPRSSPIARNASNLDSIDTNINDYIGSINGVSSGGTGMEGLASSAMHVESSLDGRSTTEYEILDGISKGTIEVEDLIEEGEEKESGDGSGKRGDSKSEVNFKAVLANLSPSSSTLPSLEVRGDEDNGLAPPSLANDPLQIFKTPLTKTPQVESGSDCPSKKKPSSEGPRVDLHISVSLSFDAAQAKDTEDGDSGNTSPKVDNNPLTPFKNLRKYWEGQVTLTETAKSAVGSILRVGETPKHSDVAKSDRATDIPEEIEVDGSKTPANDDEAGSLDLGSYIVPSTPKSDAFTPFYQALIDGLSYVVSFAIFIGMILLEPLSSFLGRAKGMFVVLIHKFMARNAAPIEAGSVPPDRADAAELSNKDPADCPGTNLSKLFFDEDLAADVGKHKESSNAVNKNLEHKKKDLAADDEKQGERSNTANKTLEHKEKALFTRIKDEVTASMMKNCKKGLSILKSSRARYAIVSSLVVLIMLMYKNGMNQDDINAVQVCENSLQEDPAGASQCLEEDDLYCYATNLTSFASILPQEILLPPSLTSFEILLEEGEEEVNDLCCAVTYKASFDSIPAWELDLSPTLFEQELHGEQEPNESGSRSWLLVFMMSSIITSNLCAFVFKSKIVPTQNQSGNKNLKGIWTEEEHEQFVEGYNEYGSRWKLVSSFVPTRTDTQVRSHGQYWLKIRSPPKMSKARKSTDATPKTPKRKTPETPRSASSNRSTPTPKKSNKTKPAPLKGILIEQDNNQLYKNVTPRSEGRTRRMRKMQGSMSDPGKRVRIQAP